MFTWVPDFVVEETAEFKTLVSKFENGAEQRRAKWSSPRRQWTLKFNNRTLAESQAIQSFFSDRKGTLESFDWVNHNDGEVYTVRFNADALRISRKAPNVCDVEMELLEVK